MVSTPRRTRTNQPTGVPSHIKTRSIMVRCRHHDYMYFHDSWMDDQTGVFYRKGYYDEAGKYYDADSIAFKKPDGSYEAHYVCDYCGTELEVNWKEGFYPTCKNCGAEMNKTPVYVDEILNVNNTSASSNQMSTRVLKKLGLVALLTVLPWLITMMVVFFIVLKSVFTDFSENDYTYTSQPQETETNLEIYGNDIYLDQVDPGVFRICSEDDPYEKHLTWDYGAQAYYDRGSDCYLWYNTDVSPNLWQYWYEDIAGSNYYGWMECEGEEWYIEVSDTEWEEYEGDTSGLWHIENEFD